MGDAARAAHGPAGDGQANRALVALLSKELDVPKARVLIVHGHASRTKLIDLPGVGRGHVEACLAAALPPARSAAPGKARAGRRRGREG